MARSGAMSKLGIDFIMTGKRTILEKRNSDKGENRRLEILFDEILDTRYEIRGGGICA